jgi:sigma-E factor negative regulatory protein RseC
MIEEQAIVTKIENRQVWVQGGQNSACGACLQKASCSTNAIGSVLNKKPVPVDCDLLLETGDKVMVAIDESLLLQASLLLYLVPLLALFTGAGLAEWLFASVADSDLWVAGSSVSAFLLSLWPINRAQSRLIKNHRVRPVVVRKI